MAVSTLGVHEVPRKGGERSKGKNKALGPYLEHSFDSKALQGKRNFWTVTTEFQAFQRARRRGNLSSPDPASAREVGTGQLSSPFSLRPCPALIWLRTQPEAQPPQPLRPRGTPDASSEDQPSNPPERQLGRAAGTWSWGDWAVILLQSLPLSGPQCPHCELRNIRQRELASCLRLVLGLINGHLLHLSPGAAPHSFFRPCWRNSALATHCPPGW